MLSKIAHYLGFHGRVQDWLKTDEWDVLCGIMGCWRVEVYQCHECQRKIKISMKDYLDIYSNEVLMEIKLDVARANADLGDYKTAIEVLKI